MRHLTFIFAILFMVSCDKENTSDCIITYANNNKASMCDGAEVQEYTFEGNVVYLVDYKCCCDYLSPVFDENCIELGALGGLIGNTKINGKEFDKEATFVKVVWKK